MASSDLAIFIGVLVVLAFILVLMYLCTQGADPTAVIGGRGGG